MHDETLARSKAMMGEARLCGACDVPTHGVHNSCAHAGTHAANAHALGVEWDFSGAARPRGVVHDEKLAYSKVMKGEARLCGACDVPTHGAHNPCRHARTHTHTVSAWSVIL